MKSRSDPAACAGCGRPHPDAGTVRLYDGREVCSYSEDWRAECEARAIMAIPGLDQRRAMLAGIGSRRGEAARLALESLIMRIWQARRDQAAA